MQFRAPYLRVTSDECQKLRKDDPKIQGAQGEGYDLWQKNIPILSRERSGTKVLVALRSHGVRMGG